MPATTPKYALPYPLPSEPVAEGAQAIRNLAEAVDDKLTGNEVAYQEVASNQIVGTSPGVVIALPSLVFNGSRAYLFEFFCAAVQLPAGAGTGCLFELFRNGAAAGRIGFVINNGQTTGTLTVPVFLRLRIIPPAGTMAYDVRGTSLAGNVTLNAGGVYPPIAFRAVAV